MDKMKKWYGVIIFLILTVVVVILPIQPIRQEMANLENMQNEVNKLQGTLKDKESQKNLLEERLKSIKASIMGAQKKIYSPVESKLEKDTLFFTLYSDLLEMVHANSIKIKSIDYKYNPEGDSFIDFDHGSSYFVCEITMKLVSNYTNLGKLIQDMYQYPYYIYISELEVNPYPKDKKILLSTVKLKLYARTEPEEVAEENNADAEPLEGAEAPLPQ